MIIDVTAIVVVMVIFVGVGLVGVAVSMLFDTENQPGNGNEASLGVRIVSDVIRDNDYDKVAKRLGISGLYLKEVVDGVSPMTPFIAFTLKKEYGFVV